MKENLLHKIKSLNSKLLENVDADNIKLNIDQKLNEHSFKTTSNNSLITIEAPTEQDLFYGLLTYLQNKEDVKEGITSSNAIERGMNVDLGRKHYTLQWFKNLIDHMALNKLNILQMHFSEYLGYRIESKVYPEITSIEHLTLEDVNEIIEYAQNYYIEVIPALDSPGHLEHVLSFYPEHQMDNLKTGLDITSMEAREFIKRLYDEVIEIFSHTDKIHIGADEFINFDDYDKYPSLEKYAQEHISENATAADTFVDFINDISSYLIDKGKSVRVWNDGLYRKNIQNTVPLNKDVIVTFWTSWNDNMAEVSTFIDHDHLLINFDDQNLYYVIGEASEYTYPTVDKISQNFDLYKFPMREEEKQKRADEVINNNKEKVLGSYFSLWSDMPEKSNEEEILKDLEKLLVPYGENLWD